MRRDIPLKTFRFENSGFGPVGQSYDAFGDGSALLVHIPGHSDGLCALLIRNADGKFALLYSDGGYATKSWRENVASGVATDRRRQAASLRWIRETSLSSDCVASFANHDPEIAPQTFVF